MLHAMVAAAILIGTAASPPPAPAPVLVVVAPARPPHQPHQQPAGADDGASVATVPTLLAARAAARRLTAAGAATVEVRLLPGVHALAEPLRLSGAQDSGVRWRGAPGAVVSGGAALSGWSAAGASGTWTAPLPSGVEFSRILWVNGERRNRTVVHGADCCNVHSTSGIFELGGETVALTAITEKGYVGNSSSFLQLENAADVELIYTRVGSSWTEGRCTLDSIVPHADGAELLVKQPCFANQRNKSYNLAVSFPLSLEQVSLASALSPGDWYLDRAKNRVVFMPTAADAALGPAKSVGSVLSAVGTDAASTALLDLDGVTGVTFEGVHFTEGDGWGGASNALGYTETQAAYHASAGSAPGQFPGFNDSAWVAVPPAIHVHGGSSGVYFTGCKFTRMGASAVMLSGGSSHGHVTNSTFTDLSGSAVMLGQVDDWKEKDESKQNRGFILAHNTVSRTSLEYRGSPGITAAYVRDTVIEKNDSGVSIVRTTQSRCVSSYLCYTDIASCHVSAFRRGGDGDVRTGTRATTPSGAIDLDDLPLQIDDSVLKNDDGLGTTTFTTTCAGRSMTAVPCTHSARKVALRTRRRSTIITVTTSATSSAASANAQDNSHLKLTAKYVSDRLLGYRPRWWVRVFSLV